MTNRFINPFPQFTDSAGKPLSAGTIGFYITGSSTLAAIYTDAANTIPAQNPMPLDARGVSRTDIFLSPAITYKAILYSDAAATIPVNTADPVVDPAANITAAIQVYAGNPNTNVAGNAGIVGGSSASMIYDITNKLLYICTTTGTASTAVWTQVAAQLSGAVSFSSVTTPTSLAATQNDYNPTNFSASSIVRQDSSVDVLITGLLAGTTGRYVIWENISAKKQTFQDQNTGSTAVNRFAIGFDYVLPPGQSVAFWYDSTSNRWRLVGAPYSAPFAPPGLRLTLTSGLPVLTADVTAAATVYYSPYINGYINLPNGAGAWYTAALSEVSQTLADTTKSPAATVASNPYDVFVWNDAGTIRATRGPTWLAGAVAGSVTARGTGAGSTELVRDSVAGVWTNKNAITNGPAAGLGVYVGSFITNAGNTVDWVANPAAAAGGGNARLNLWNMYNRVLVSATSIDNTATSVTGSGAWRAATASNSNRITYFAGLAEGTLISDMSANLSTNNSVASSIGISLDSVTVTSVAAYGNQSANSADIRTETIIYRGPVLIGQHFLQASDNGSTVVSYTFNGFVYRLSFQAMM